MSAESVRAWLAERAPELELIEVAETTATVTTAAAALGVLPAQIAKTLAIRAGDHLFLLVTRGDARLDNAKSKAEFGARPRMLSPEETLEVTGHPVGGVCPFGLARPLPVYLDISLQPFATVYPAGGSLSPHFAAASFRVGRRPLGRPLPAAGKIRPLNQTGFPSS